MKKYFYYYYTMVWDLPHPRTRYDIYTVGEFDTSSVSKIKNDDIYDLQLIPTKILSTTHMPKDWDGELNMSASQFKNWTFDTLTDAQRFCIKEILLSESILR